MAFLLPPPPSRWWDWHSFFSSPLLSFPLRFLPPLPLSLSLAPPNPPSEPNQKNPLSATQTHSLSQLQSSLQHIPKHSKHNKQAKVASSWSASRIGAQSEPTNQTRHPTAPGFGCHPLANHRPRPDAFRHQIVSEWVCWIGQSGAAPCDDRVSGSASVLWQPVDWEGEEHAVCEERNGRAQGGREHPAKQQQQAEGRKEGRKGALSPPLLGLCLTPPSSP